jgi:hypothetical protein
MRIISLKGLKGRPNHLFNQPGPLFPPYFMIARVLIYITLTVR